MALSHLLLRGRSELFGLLCSNSSRHVEGQHQLIVAELLVELQLGDEAVGEGHDGLDTVLQLAVAEIVKQLAHLGNRQGEETNNKYRCITAARLDAAVTSKSVRNTYKQPYGFTLSHLLKRHFYPRDHLFDTGQSHFMFD